MTNKEYLDVTGIDIMQWLKDEWNQKYEGRMPNCFRIQILMEPVEEIGDLHADRIDYKRDGSFSENLAMQQFINSDVFKED